MTKQVAPAPTTLTQATEQLHRQRPSRDAEPGAWIAFHRHSADIYSQVASIDHSHRHEALAYAAQELRQAHGIEARLAES